MADDHTEAAVHVNGIDLHYEIDGAGDPLLLLHGGTGCHRDWVHAGRIQLARDYQLIAPDARGHSQSTNPQISFDWNFIPSRDVEWTAHQHLQG